MSHIRSLQHLAFLFFATHSLNTLQFILGRELSINIKPITADLRGDIRLFREVVHDSTVRGKPGNEGKR